MSKQPLTPHERLLILQAITWVKTIHDARPAGSPPGYPGAADLESSALFRRIRQGLAPMPWAPPTRQRHPAYELIEDARSEHRVQARVDVAEPTVDIDGARWRRLESRDEGRAHVVAFGHWPLSYLLESRERPRWPSLPPDLDEGPAHEVVRFADGRLVPKDLLRRTRHERETQWWLRCVSPLNEGLYLGGERLPLEDPARFRPVEVPRSAPDGRALVCVCALAGGPMALFELAFDPWTAVGRYLAVPLEDSPQVPEPWLRAFDAGAGPLDVLPGQAGWQVFEIDRGGHPHSAWRSARRDWLAPVHA